VALPVGATSLDEADAAVELWEHYKGRKLDDGQRLDVAVMLATRDDGLWAASVTGHEKPRQSGKGDAIEVVELWGTTQRSERILHTIHDAVLLATETQSRMLSLLDSHADLRRLKSKEWKGTGQQKIEFRNGGVIWYRTRTGAGGRGIDEVDRLVVDEAQHAEFQHLSAITPTQAVSANPQLNALGTGGLAGKSDWWWSLRKQAKGTPGAFAWLGWSAQRWDVDDSGRVSIDDVDPFNRELWWQTIPGLVAGRTTIEFLERELRILGPEGFAQEYLCVWAPPPDVGGNSPIPLDVWETLTDATSATASNAARVAFDVSTDRRFSCFSAAGRRADGLGHVEVRDNRPGTDWVLMRAGELAEGHGCPITVMRGSPGASFIDEFERAGIEVDVMSPNDYAEACGRFIDATRGVTPDIRHRGQPLLRVALSAAQTKPSGDGGLVWSRRSSTTDITPLTTATMAWGRVGDGVDAPATFFAY